MKLMPLYGEKRGKYALLINKDKISKLIGTPLAIVVLIVSLSTSITVYYLVDRNSQNDTRVRFDYYKQLLITKMQNQMDQYAQALRGAAGLFYGSSEVTRTDWKHYVDTLDIQGYYPGIQGMGYSQMIHGKDKATNIEQVRAQGFSQYDVYPSGTRNEYSPILYIEPFDWRNQRAFGFDMYSDKSMKEAMDRARDTGRVSVTDKVILMQETVQDTQVGFIMYIPVYSHPASTNLNLEERRKLIRGFVYSPFRMKDLMREITNTVGDYLDVKVYDGAEVTPYTLMYNSKEGSDENDDRYLEEKIVQNIGGRPWTVVINTGDDFNQYIRQSDQSIFVLICGLVISILLFIITWSLSTSRVRAIRLAEKMTADLRISEERYALSVAGSSDGLWDWNIKDRSLYLSPRFKKLLHYSDTELANETKALTMLAHPDDYEEANSALQNHLKKREPFDIECRLRQRNGEYAWFRIKGQAIWDKSGNALRMAGSLSDINDRKLAAIYLQKQKHELEIANKYKSEFLANMSHELRTPLNSILVLSNLLSEDRVNIVNQKQREQAGIIYKCGAELLDLITDILDLSKIEAGKMDIYVDKLSIVDFGQEINMLFKTTAEDKGLSFNVVIDENVPKYIFTDHKRLYQVVKNLCSNALKFTSIGSVNVRFYRPSSVSGINDSMDLKNTICISISDTGIGIPEDKFELIFQAFRQADGTTSRQYGGTGLGLTISREIVTLLGGAITVESEQSKGSVFTVYVKTTSESSETTSEVEVIKEEVFIEKSIPQVQEPQVDQKNMLNARVLLVDDDIRNIYAMTALLESYGCSVIYAENGADAVDLVEHDGQFDVILMDMMMPIMDGYTAMKTLRKDPSFNIPIIALTAKAMAGDREKCINSGANEYLAKPVKKDELIPMIEKMLKNESGKPIDSSEGGI